MKRNKQFDELLAKVPEETKRRVEKRLTCKWLRNGDKCGKGLPGTPCEVDGCVAWEHYEPADPMNSLDEKTKEAVKTTNAIKYLVTRGWTCIAPGGIDLKKLPDATREFIEAVEGYVCPKKEDKYVFRNEVLAKCNALKKLLNETE